MVGEVEIKRKKRREQKKKWRESNPEKHKAQKKRDRIRRRQRKQGIDVFYYTYIDWVKQVPYKVDYKLTREPVTISKLTRKRIPLTINKDPEQRMKELRVQKLFYGIKKRSRKKGIECNINSYKEIEIPTHCPYLNIEISYDGTRGKNAASIDKIIPELGYTKGNIQIISMLANQMKSNATIKELLTFAKSIVSTEEKIEKIMSMREMIKTIFVEKIPNNKYSNSNI